MLNMISTITMVGAGKVYDNLMVDVKATNQKLIDRSIRIIQDICDISYQQSENYIMLQIITLKLLSLCICVIHQKQMHNSV